jgi:predicted kinase
MKKPRPILVMVSGPALSGKSTLLARISNEVIKMKIVSTDDIRMELYQSYEFKLDKEPEIWATAYKRINQFLEKGHVVAIDATLRTRQLRQEILKRYKDYPILYLAFEKPTLTTLMQRNELRKWKQFSTEVVKKMHDDYEFPSTSEQKGYTKFFVIKRSDLETTIVNIVQWLHQEH